MVCSVPIMVFRVPIRQSSPLQMILLVMDLNATSTQSELFKVGTKMSLAGSSSLYMCAQPYLYFKWHQMYSMNMSGSHVYI